MVQPVGDVLAGDAQSGAVLHQAHIVDVRHLGAAHALVDPTHNIAENALRVVVQFRLHLLRRKVFAGQQGNAQDVVQAGRGAGLQYRLPRRHIHLVVVHGVQGGGGGRRHPGGVGAGFGMADLDRQHLRHPVRLRPHALADLGTAAEAAGQPHVQVGVLVGGDPGLPLDALLGQEGAGLHAGVDFVPGAVQKAGVDEDDASPRLVNAGG